MASPLPIGPPWTMFQVEAAKAFVGYKLQALTAGYARVWFYFCLRGTGVPMTQTIAAIVAEPNSEIAGAELGKRLQDGLGGAPQAIVLFASARHDYQRLLLALSKASGTEVIVGSSSGGEFSNLESGQGWVSALGIRSQSMRFAVGLGREVGRDQAAAARQVASAFTGIKTPALPYRAAMVMTDALAGHADAMVEELTLATGGNYRFFGGGAGDDGRFQKTHVFAGTQAVTDAVVALEILSARPIGVGVSHGWEPASEAMRVTETAGSRLFSLNGMPAADVIADFAARDGQKFDRADPLPFFLHNILGISDEQQFRLRVPLAVHDDGSISLAAEVPQEAIVHVMKTSERSAMLAAEQATRAALAALNGSKPQAALVFDCVATRLRLGTAFDNELKACAAMLNPAHFVGCNTYGQIARAEGQFGGFHNCTAVVCVFPQ